MKIPNSREIQRAAFNHSWDIDFKDFIKIYKKWIAIKFLLHMFWETKLGLLTYFL